MKFLGVIAFILVLLMGSAIGQPFATHATRCIISGIDPISGTQDTQVHIYGYGFDKAAKVFFGNMESKEAAWISQNELRAKAPVQPAVAKFAPKWSNNHAVIGIMNSDVSEATLSPGFWYK